MYHRTKNCSKWGWRSSVDFSVPTILWSQVRIPCAPSTLFSIIVKFCAIFDIVLKKNENKQKEASCGPIQKNAAMSVTRQEVLQNWFVVALSQVILSRDNGIAKNRMKRSLKPNYFSVSVSSMGKKTLLMS